MILIMNWLRKWGNKMMGDFEKLCNEFRENKRLIEELEDYNDTIKAHIIELMGNNDTMIQGLLLWDSNKEIYSSLIK